MAKRKHHRYGSFGDLAGALDTSVKPMDVLVGAAAGLAGIAAGKWAYGKLKEHLPASITIPEAVDDLVPAIGAAAAGVGLYFAQKKSTSGAGHLAGSLAVGLSNTAALLAAKYDVPGFSGINDVNFSGVVTKRFGIVAPNPRLNGVRNVRFGLVAPNPRLGIVAPNPSQRAAVLTRPSAVRAD